ncbi:MAG TPA: glycoside hydrolase family 3 protein [Lachnospiraceae bacterium]|nr:glycoside hydrolase family 3 protein [Lachnospiraceae bacterium]
MDRRKRKILWKWLLGVGLLVLTVEVIAIAYGIFGTHSNEKSEGSSIGSLAEAHTNGGQNTSVDIDDNSSVNPINDTEGEDIGTQATDGYTTDNGNKEDTQDLENTNFQNIAEEGDTTDKGSDLQTVEVSSLKNNTNEKVHDILEDMTLYEKVCQMYIVFPEAITNVENVISAGKKTKSALKQYPVGGFIYMADNLKNEKQVTDMIKGVQSYAKIPMFIACDEEGGRVARVMKTLKSYSMNPMMTYKDKGLKIAYKNARTIASAIKKYGFNTDFAPVADVWSNPSNTVIGDRAYSDNYKQAAKLLPGAVKGFRKESVVCSLKHFPGHGDTSTDSHYGSAYVTKSLKELRKEEFLPFKAGIDAGADMVMVGHLIVSDVDTVPATFSHYLITDILRGELGFDGVVITDALNMQAMTDHYGNSYTTVQAVKAGVDILLCPADIDQSIKALIKAVEKGEISEDRIDESVTRILKLKIEKGIIE